MKELLANAQLSLCERDGVLVLELHGAPMNEIGLSMLAALENALQMIASVPYTPLVITSGIANTFSAGADLRELHAQLLQRREDKLSDHEARAKLRAVIARIHAVMNTIDTSERLVIAHTQGVVFGGGLELALTADIIVAERSSRFGFPELRLGLIPGFGGIPRLQRDVGNAVVRDLLFTGRSLGAERAYQLGLVAHLAAEGAGLTLSLRLAQQAAKFNGNAFAVAKKFTKRIPLAELEREQEIFVEMALSSDVLEKALSRFTNDKSAQPYLP